MIESGVDERLLLLEALGKNFRLYLRCAKCSGVFFHGSGHLQTDAPVVCPNCFNSAPSTAYSSAIGMLGEVGLPELDEVMGGEY